MFSITACCLIASSIFLCASTSNGSMFNRSISLCWAISASYCLSLVCLSSSANRAGSDWAAAASSGWAYAIIIRYIEYTCISERIPREIGLGQTCSSSLISSGLPRSCSRIVSASCCMVLEAWAGPNPQLTLPPRMSIEGKHTVLSLRHLNSSFASTTTSQTPLAPQALVS